MPAIAPPQPDEVVDDYVPISISTLIPDQCIDIDLFLRDSDGRGTRLYRASETPFEAKDAHRLAENNVRTLYIRQGDGGKYQEYLKQNIGCVVADESRPVAARFASLNDVVRDVLASLFENGDVDEAIASTESMADHCVELLGRDDYSVAEMLGVLHHDYRTFTHSTNVAFLCVMLARALGIDDADTIREIAVGGFLHDLGKLEIPERILTKTDRLTDAERELMEKHPGWGFEKLRSRDDVSFGQLMMVYQHHEKVNGTGYPVGIRREQIHDWARICTVADVFEALTARRPYRRRLPRAEVLRIMNRDGGRTFDREMLTCWLTTIGRRSATA